MAENIQQLLFERTQLTNIRVYFIGIGGIGMSALARFFQQNGAIVSGYDRHQSELCKKLESEGISIHYEDSLDLLDKSADIVIYTPAIPKEMHELNFYKDHEYKLMKRSEILQWITEGTFNICIGGTHGKSTITSLVSHILKDSQFGCNAFLGAISVNYDTNFWKDEHAVSVVEADEYDRSFLRLSPNVAVITAMDADHLDIYGTLENVQHAFIDFSKRIRPEGCLIVKKGLAKETDLVANHKYTYSFNDETADYRATNLRIENGSYLYDVITPNGTIKDITLHLGGIHNIENSLAAIAVSQFVKIEESLIKNAISSFRGVKRRFEYVIKDETHVMIDDYAHHPAELRALLEGVKTLYKQKIVAVFQPHLYTRTRDLADGFAESLDIADEVILLPIYPARELPIDGVDSQLILDKMKIQNKRVLSKAEIIDTIKEENPPLLVMCGAGDIDELIPEVKNVLEKNI